MPSPAHKQRPYNNNNGSSLVKLTSSAFSGYDPEEDDMRGIFLARGPGFKSSGEELPPIKLVDVYQVLTHALNIVPQPNNGTWEHVAGLFINGESSTTSSQSPTPPLNVVLFFNIILSS